MAGRGAPTFLKRQKEQKRAARALEKRVAKQARRENRANGSKQDEFLDEVLTEPNLPNWDESGIESPDESTAE